MKTSGSGPNAGIEENARLNERECRERAITLSSYPRSLFLQLDAPCNQNCLFCSRPASYAHFDLETYRARFEEKLAVALDRAERLHLTGSGELLILPEAAKILRYFNRFRGAEKMFATNGSSLTPKMVDLIAGSENRYTVHVSLHSSDPALHRLMTGSDTYGIVRANLDYLASVRDAAKNLSVNFVFLATTKNVKRLLDFIAFAAERRADAVIVYYNYVYRLDQKELSCYFAQDETNDVLDLARAYAARFSGTGFRVVLPPKFRQPAYAAGGLCGEAWSQMMINPDGDIISCDVAGDSRESLRDNTFDEVWNGAYYTALRRILKDGRNACSTHCFRANPAAVNDFRSHIITRGKSAEEVGRLMENA